MSTERFSYSRILCDSIHWLSRKPCNVRNHCFCTNSDEHEKELCGLQSREDFAAFLQHRSNELINGGVRILSILTIDSEKKNIRQAHGTFVYKCTQSFLTEEELFNFTIPIHFRTSDECIDLDLFNQHSLQVISTEKITARLPMFEQYEQGKSTVDQLAKQVVGSMRAWSNATLEQAMRNHGRTEEEIGKVSDLIWTAVEEEVKKKPLELDVAPISTLLILKKIK